MPRKIRVLIGKPGLDGHDRGAKVVAAALRDAGMEVIYTGLHQSCEGIVEAAIQEDVDIIGLSILSGAHMTIFPKVINLLNSRKARDITVIGGGIIPSHDIKKLERAGVKKLFGPGSPTSEIITWIKEYVNGGHKPKLKKQKRKIAVKKKKIKAGRKTKKAKKR